MSADHRGQIGFEGQLQFKLIKHGPIKRQFNRLRRLHDISKPDKEVDLLKTMRG